jgi:protein-ribulosamine 3-kinase
VLALEWLRLDAGASADAALGEQLALQHRCTAPAFGWHRDNTIGSTRQVNTRSDSWVEFFRERRLRYQLDLAARNGHLYQVLNHLNLFGAGYLSQARALTRPTLARLV